MNKIKTSVLVAIVAALIFALAPFIEAGQQGGTTRYEYDANGRLKTVTLPNGERVIYDYDAAGNIKSITRQTLTTILGISPTEGPVGTQATITGNGFLTTASANTVLINGTAAGVISATVTQLVVEVPVGATTGNITVTNTNGTATSAQIFTVTAAGEGPPTITGFSPFIGNPGTVVTINGTGFLPTPSDNVVKFNETTATIDSATSTRIVARVPAGATTGSISVSTASGTGFGNSFIVTDAEFIAQMAPGESQTATINTPNKSALLTFNGVEGQRVSITLTSFNVTGHNDVRMTLYDPTGNQLANTSLDFSPFFIDAMTLSSTGIYALLVDVSPGTGTFVVNIHNVVDVSGILTADGPTAPLSLTTPGQNARFTFNGSTGQRLILRLTNIDMVPNVNINISVQAPDESFVADAITLDVNSILIRTGLLPVTGIYSVLIDPTAFRAATGNMNVTLATQPADVTGSLTADGPSLTLTTGVPGQDARATFAGTAGQKLNLQINPVTIPASTVLINNPDGTALVQQTSVDARGWFIELPDLPQSGTYTVLVVPVSEATGSVTLTLLTAAPISIAPDGSSVQVNITTPNQRPRLIFNGTAGQRVSLNVPTLTISQITVQILRPDGTQLSSNVLFSSGASRFIEPQTLPSTGAYTIVITPSNAFATGNMTLALYDVPADISGTIEIGGASVPLTISTPGQNATLTFNATSGQQVTVRLTGNTISTVTVSLLRPNGTTVTSLTRTTSSFDLTTQTLTVSGTYTIRIDPFGATTGSINVRVTSP